MKVFRKFLPNVHLSYVNYKEYYNKQIEDKIMLEFG